MSCNGFKRRWPALLRVFCLTAIVLAMSMAAGVRTAHALAPAGTSINNQAIGTYTDDSGVQQSVTSNAVTTVVQQVAALSLVASSTKIATAGSVVTFSHTITNTGNGTDVFLLTATDNGGDNFNITPLIYADANGDGIADNLLPITRTPSLAAGATFQFVVSGLVPITVVNGNTATLNVRGESTFTPGVFNTPPVVDTVNITTNAQINVVKSIDKNSGLPGTGPYTYTLTYTNSGNVAATNLIITDLLPIGVTYNADSGRWSNSGATVLGDGVGGDPAGINYGYSTLTRTVTANVATVAPGATGRISFSVNVNAGIVPQILPNIAIYGYNDGTVVPIINQPTNAVNLTIGQGVDFTFAGQDKTGGAQQGEVLTYVNTLTNTGSGPDTFNVVMGISTFPLGTTFQLFQSDCTTPLQDTNGDGIFDTGPVAAGASYAVNLKVNLPPLALGIGPYGVQKIATSVTNPLIIRIANDTLDSITPATVDLLNDAINAGAGAGPEAAPVTIFDVAGGATVRIPLYIRNTSAIPDTYALFVSANGTFSPIVSLPLGFGVSFKNLAGGVITSTGVVPPGTTAQIFADVTVPSGTTPGNVEVYFRVISLLTGASDIKHDAVNVTALRSLSITPVGSGQVYPGNAVSYTHQLTNTGTLPEGNGILSTVALSTADSIAGFSSVVYRDGNNNGILDETDPVFTNLTDLGPLGLLPGASVTVFVKVFAPAGATLGTMNVTTLTATTTGGLLVPAPATVRDTTTVIAGQLRMDKTHALDAAGTGVAAGAYSTARITAGAVPGANVRYRIVVTNVGTAPATNVIISDATPAYTIYDIGNGSNGLNGRAVYTRDGTTFTPATTVPADVNGKGSIRFEVGTINPGETVTIYFGVEIE